MKNSANFRRNQEGKDKWKTYADVQCILSGRCLIKHPTIFPDTNHPIQVLSEGSYFGESSLLQVQSLNYFGDIYADGGSHNDSEETEFFKIARSDFEARIPIWEREKIK